MKKQNLFVVLLVLCIITMAVGYSIFRTDIEVNGRTAVFEDLQVIFVKIGKIEEINSMDASAVISEDGKKVTISVPKLMVKGAYAKIPITIKNVGTVPAKLRSISQFGLGNNTAISVSYTGIGVTDSVLEPGDKQTFDVKVSWTRDLYNNICNYDFFIKFNYVQG